MTYPRILLGSLVVVGLIGAYRLHASGTGDVRIGALTALRPAPAKPYVPAGPRGMSAAEVPPFWVRPGYEVSLAAEGLRQARFIEFDDKGTLFVSMPGVGRIASLRAEGDRYVQFANFVINKPSVHAMHFQGGWLWFATTGAIYRARDIDGDGAADEMRTVVPEGSMPSGGRHPKRSLCVTSNAIYTSIGDDGNITDEQTTERQKVWRFNRDGTGKRLWSSGLRNTEKLRMRPGTNELYGCDHGSDWFGQPLGETKAAQPMTDLNPPCEFNRYIEGGFYGHPFLVGNRVPRVEYQNRPDIIELAAATIPPAWNLGAHWAPNGFTFLRTNGLGPGFARDAIVALHGSWNRSERSGYRVERITFDNATGVPYGSMPLVICLSSSGEVLGRPCDVAEAPDGSVLFTDDSTMRIYRIRRS